MGGPGYTVKDLMWWTGFIAGAAITSLSLQQLEWHGLLRLIVSVGVGMVMGYLLELSYERSRRPRPPRDAGPGEDEDFNSYKRDDRY